MHGSAHPGPQHSECSSHGKGKRPWPKGERGLGKKESELVILHKIFFRLYKLGQVPYTHHPVSPHALLPLHVFLAWQIFTKSLSSSQLLWQNLTKMLRLVICIQNLKTLFWKRRQSPRLMLMSKQMFIIIIVTKKLTQSIKQPPPIYLRVTA